MLRACVIQESAIMRQHVSNMLAELSVDVVDGVQGCDVAFIDDALSYDEREKLALQTTLILCTTKYDVEALQDAFQHSVSEYIMMPCDLEILRSKLDCLNLL